jgi:hypothetical protein
MSNSSVLARFARNRYESEFVINGRPVTVADASIEYIGKDRVLVLKFRDFQLLPASRCPERGRYESILRAAGDPEAIARLEPACNLIKINARACQGCPERPL